VNTKSFTASVIVLAILAATGTRELRASEPTQAALKAEARITLNQAKETALAKVPNGNIQAAELEREHGRLIWSFDISRPSSKNITEIQVDAKTGKIVSTQLESPSHQAAENAADKKQKM